MLVSGADFGVVVLGSGGGGGPTAVIGVAAKETSSTLRVVAGLGSGPVFESETNFRVTVCGPGCDQAAGGDRDFLSCW